MEGRCTCGNLQYRLKSEPMIVHCCHCTWCQRETGSAFAVNAVIEADRVEILAGTPEIIDTPSASGKGQKISRCPQCKVAVWSNYSGLGDLQKFVRVGTLNEPSACPPDVHIYTSTKLDWVVLPEGVPAFPEYYQRSKVWREDSIKRRNILTGSAKTEK